MPQEDQKKNGKPTAEISNEYDGKDGKGDISLFVCYGMVWSGMDSLNVRCTFVDKCTALGASPAQCALASAPASVGPKRDAPVTAASHGVPYRSKTCLAHALLL